MEDTACAQKLPSGCPADGVLGPISCAMPELAGARCALHCRARGTGNTQWRIHASAGAITHVTRLKRVVVSGCVSRRSQQRPRSTTRWGIEHAASQSRGKRPSRSAAEIDVCGNRSIAALLRNPAEDLRHCAEKTTRRIQFSIR